MRHGFTLLEIVMALTILALLSGMVFGIIRVSMNTATETRALQLENDAVSRFILLCRHTFQNLPSTAILTLTITEKGTPPQQELTLSGVPEAFAFGVNPMSYKDSILGLRPDLTATNASETGAPLYTLALSREDIIPKDPNQPPGAASPSGEGAAAPDDQGRYWMPLMSNVTSLSWRFLKEDDVWEEEWDSTNLPLLVEMNLLLQERTQPLRVVFALPTTKLSGANPALAPKTNGQSTTPTVAGGSGGDARDSSQRGRDSGKRGSDSGKDERSRSGGSPNAQGGRPDGPRGGTPGGAGGSEAGPRSNGAAPNPQATGNPSR
ncbi:MAG: prepilin-type N-terminal cleavage/methylation domain-containing protein [Roseimicrobium sp.]